MKKEIPTIVLDGITRNHNSKGEIIIKQGGNHYKYDVLALLRTIADLYEMLYDHGVPSQVIDNVMRSAGNSENVIEEFSSAYSDYVLTDIKK